MKLVDANSLQRLGNKRKDATLLKGEQTLTPEEQTQVKQNLGISEGGVTSINGKTGALTLNNVAFSGNYNDLNNRPSIPPSPHAYLIQAWNNGQNWWRKYSDGFIEQGGIVTNAGNGYTTTTINLNIAFSSTNYSVCPIGTWNDGTGKGSVIKGKTATYFVVEWVALVNNGLYPSWYACGY